MSKRLATLALVSAAVLGMAGAASAQTQNGTDNRANDPELNYNTTAPSGSGGAMQPRQNGNMGTTGQGSATTPSTKSGNQPPPAGGEGRVDKDNQQ